MDVGARNIEFDRGDTVERSDAAGAFGVVVGRRTAHVHDGVRVDVGEEGIDVLGKVVDSFVLQADAIEHARCGLGHARIVVTLTGE